MNNNSKFILHVSDFHLRDEDSDQKRATTALKSLVKQLRSDGIEVDYLIHTGDVIDSNDLYEKVAKDLDLWKVDEIFDISKFKENIKDIDDKKKTIFNQNLCKIIERRFNSAISIMKTFISDLNIPFGNVIICCGNHDALRPLPTASDKPISCTELPQNKSVSITNSSLDQKKYTGENTRIFDFFESFLNELGVANSKSRCGKNKSVINCTLGNLNFLIINTSWSNPKEIKSGYYCVYCHQIQNYIQNDFKNNIKKNKENILNIILAHKPLYEICEAARLSYKKYMKTPFMSSLQQFVGNRGIYLCGDKHTRSIMNSSFHDIPHYMCGEPLSMLNEENKKFEVEYNLFEVVEGNIRIERKIHLESRNDTDWICTLRPQDTIVSNLYNFSKEFIIKNTLEILLISQHHTWENLCQQIYNWKKEVRKQWYENLNTMFIAICKYRKQGLPTNTRG